MIIKAFQLKRVCGLNLLQLILNNKLRKILTASERCVFLLWTVEYNIRERKVCSTISK